MSCAFVELDPDPNFYRDVDLSISSSSPLSPPSDLDPNFTESFPFESNLFLMSTKYEFSYRLYVARSEDLIVYRARDKETGVAVAIKIERGLDSKGSTREICLLGAAQTHLNVVKFYGYFEFPLNNCFAIVMEYVPRCAIDEIPLDEYTHQLLSALAHLHARGIIHRDVKPANFIWNAEQERGVLIDFDISTFQNKEEGHRTWVGTDGFTAPEVLDVVDEKTKGYDEKVDCYSAGVTFGSLLFGVSHAALIFHEKHPHFWFAKFREGDDVDAWDLLLKLIAKDPEKRISCADALQHPYFGHTKLASTT